MKNPHATPVARIRNIARDLYCNSLDLKDWIIGKHDPLMPPRRKNNFVGGKDFKKIGEKWVRLFVEQGGLKASDQVLDVGCGIGRMAVPLTKVLRPSGGYAGFDIDRECIEWCNRAISTRFPNFRFKHADIFNARYNPKGKIQSSDFTFPYQANSFDFVFLTSVFTHMLPSDVERYISEISRVLKPGGKCFVTAYIMDATAKAAVKEGRAAYKMTKVGGYYAEVTELVEDAIAFDEDIFDQMFQKHGLTPTGIKNFGSWRGTKNQYSRQDYVLYQKNVQ